MPLEVFVLIIGFANVVVVLEFVRRRKLAESFALLWMVVAIGGLLLVLARPLIDRFSSKVGVDAGTSIVFSLAILLLLVVSMYLSVHITSLEDKVEALAEELAVVRGIRHPEPDSPDLSDPPDLPVSPDSSGPSIVSSNAGDEAEPKR